MKGHYRALTPADWAVLALAAAPPFGYALGAAVMGVVYVIRWFV